MNPSRINLTVPNRSLWTPGTTGVVAVGADPANARFVRYNQPLPGAFAVAPYYEMALARTTRNARLFWLSWKNWMLFLG